jgi:type I restriction enzyme M protein
MGSGPDGTALPKRWIQAKTESGGTDRVWFYDTQADGHSLDDKRAPLLDEENLGPTPSRQLSEEEHAKNNLPDALKRWTERDGSERSRARTEQSFCVPRAEIAAEQYDLSLGRYKELVYEATEHRPPMEIMAEIELLDGQLQEELEELKGMIG